MYHPMLLKTIPGDPKSSKNCCGKYIHPSSAGHIFSRPRIQETLLSSAHNMPRHNRKKRIQTWQVFSTKQVGLEGPFFSLPASSIFLSLNPTVNKSSYCIIWTIRSKWDVYFEPSYQSEILLQVAMNSTPSTYPKEGNYENLRPGGSVIDFWVRKHRAQRTKIILIISTLHLRTPRRFAPFPPEATRWSVSKHGCCARHVLQRPA